MEIKNFRIGNNVFFDGKVQEISSIHSDNTIRLKENKDSKCHGCYKVNRIKPIQLTEEVLLKCGFEKDIEFDNTYNKRISVHNGFTTISIDISYFILLLDCMEINVEYLHTLQNLIHALTGEELTYNHS